MELVTSPVITIPANAGTIQNAIFPNDTIVVMNPVTGVTIKGIVGAVAAGNITAYPFQAANWDALGTGVQNLKVFVYGSIFAKGTTSGSKSIEPQFTQYSNQPIIIKDRYEINGSDTAQIGWVEVATEDGTSGYLWYLKSESETRLRFDDYLEMAMVESELAAGAAGINFAASSANVPGFTAAGGAAVAHGSEGLFAAITARGNVMTGFSTVVLVSLTLIKCLKILILKELLKKTCFS